MPGTIEFRINLDFTLGTPVQYENLTMHPLLAEDGGAPDYLTLDEALDSGTAHVTEVSEAGSVPELRFDNRGERRVLLLDGEELVGEKQNRVLNLSIMAPARRAIHIPVSCVEAGRWHRKSHGFSSSGRVQYARGRARKVEQVSCALRSTGARTSNQGAVWTDIDEKMERMGVGSRTRAMSDVYETHSRSVEDFVRAFSPRPDQAGALFAIGGRAVGLDLFDYAATLRRTLPKLVRAYALDALDELISNVGRERSSTAEREPAADGDGVARLLHDLRRARVSRFPAVGEGHDLRLASRRLHGAALEVDGRILHLAAFAR